MDNSNSFEESGDRNLLSDKLNGRWTNEEHQAFLEGISTSTSGLKMFGKNWKRIESVVKTRTGSQIRSHAQKFFNKINEKKKKSIASDGDPENSNL